MQAEVRIVPSRDEHLPSFQAVFDAVARERRYLAFLEAPPLDAIQRFVAELRRHGGVQVFAVDSRDNVVGWCDITRISRDGYRHCGVLGMGLLPEYRGRGVGAQLALSAIVAARQNDVERIELQVFASNERAVALYRHLGFVEEGVKRQSWKLDGRYDDIVLMALFGPPVSHVSRPRG